jgi:16S rRNA (guanine966-N2)-methyltransferase
MRISGGGARGIPLVVPPGELVRPATDGLRQAVFSSLGARVAGARFLDLFAGSGAYGLEAFSRGAAGGTFVERHPKALACLRRNLAGVCRSLGRSESELAVVGGDVLPALAGLAGQPDLIFVDPPYELIAEVAPAVFARLGERLAPALDALVVFELPGDLAIAPEGWTCLKRIGRGVRQPTAAFFRRG